MDILAKTYKGMEEILASEIEKIGGTDIEIGNRAVSFKGDTETLYKANLWSRVATRFLVPILQFDAHDADELYAYAKSIDWSRYLDIKKTFSVESTVYSSEFTHSKFVTYRVKDAIADYFMEKEDKRPSVGLTNPDLMIDIHISGTHCTLSIDSTGESLHKRGYKSVQTDAPISEAMAAGMLLMAGWNGETDFIDPMCGSGTIVIEAALIALNIPPGIFRDSFAFEKWGDFDKSLFEKLYEDDSEQREFTGKIYARDISVRALAAAEQNAKAAGVAKYIDFQQCDIEELAMPETDSQLLLVTNPPYGERLKPEKIQDLYAALGRFFKQQVKNGFAWVISSSDDYLQCIGMRPDKKIPVLNGDIECLFCGYEIFEGSRKDFLKGKEEKGEYKPRDTKSLDVRDKDGNEFAHTEDGQFRFDAIQTTMRDGIRMGEWVRHPNDYDGEIRRSRRFIKMDRWEKKSRFDDEEGRNGRLNRDERPKKEYKKFRDRYEEDDENGGEGHGEGRVRRGRDNRSKGEYRGGRERGDYREKREGREERPRRDAKPRYGEKRFDNDRRRSGGKRPFGGGNNRRDNFRGGRSGRGGSNDRQSWGDAED